MREFYAVQKDMEFEDGYALETIAVFETKEEADEFLEKLTEGMGYERFDYGVYVYNFGERMMTGFDIHEEQD